MSDSNSQASALLAFLTSQAQRRETFIPGFRVKAPSTAQRGAVEELAAELLEERRTDGQYKALLAQLPGHEDIMRLDDAAPGAGPDAAVEAGTNPADAISVKLVPEFEEVTNQELGFKVVISLKAIADVVKPANIALTAVVDTSSSMRGQKIELVKGTVEFLAEQLGANDALGLVTYSDSAKCDLPLLLMTPAAKSIAKAVNNRINTKYWTALQDGLMMAVKEHSADAKSSSGTRRVRSIFLCTDGLPTIGPCDALSIVSALRAQLAPLAAADEPVSISTFGFGADHDPKLLQAIAEAGNGIYYYIQNDRQIPEAFGDALGGLLSVVASNVRISITAETAGGGVMISNVHSGGKIETTADPSKQRVVKFADLFADENREMLLELQLPATQQDDRQTQQLVKVDVSYTDPVSGVTVNRRHVLDVTRSAVVPAGQKRNDLVATTAARFQVAEAVKAAGAESDAGRYGGAELLLEDAKQKVRQQGIGEAEWVFVEQLDNMAKAIRAAKQLKAARDARHNAQYQAAVSTRLHSYSHAMQSQRATSVHFSVAVPAAQPAYDGLQLQQQMAAPGASWGSAVSAVNAPVHGTAPAAPAVTAPVTLDFMSSTNAMRSKMSVTASDFVAKRARI